MTREAAVLALHGLMRRHQVRDLVVVALEAEVVARFDQQDGLVRSVRVVAVQACTLLEGVVLDGVVVGEIPGVVAGETELTILLDHLERIVLGWLGVAGVELEGDHRVVGALLQEHLLRRAVRVVADGAGALLHGVFAMGILEGGVPAVVAGLTELGRRVDEQIGYRRGVGEVASPAPLLLEDLVPDLLRVVLFLVALEADRVALCTQEVWRVRSMGVVTRNAALALQGSVDSGDVELHVLYAVAFIAELVPLPLEKRLPDESVTEVAFLALPVLDDLVDVVLGQVLFNELVVAVQALLLLELPLLRIGRRRKREQEGAAARDRHPDEHGSADRARVQHPIAELRGFTAGSYSGSPWRKILGS
jgi:hypothetical protein